MRYCAGERAVSSLRIQVLRPLGANAYCLLGDDLSIDQRDSQRLCDPDVAEEPEECGQGSCSCAPRIDPEGTPPRVLSLIHLTDPTRETLRVMEAKGNGP